MRRKCSSNRSFFVAFDLTADRSGVSQSILILIAPQHASSRPDAANVLFHVVNNRHLRKRPMIFTTNKPFSEWGKVLHDEDLAAAILDRILERGRVIHLDGPSWRTRHLNLEEPLPPAAERARISGIGVPEFSEPTSVTGYALGNAIKRRRSLNAMAITREEFFSKQYYRAMGENRRYCKCFQCGNGPVSIAASFVASEPCECGAT